MQKNGKEKKSVLSAKWFLRDRSVCNVYDTDFELLTPDGELTFWEYVDFLREVMYEEYVEILRPTLIAMKKK